MSERDLFRCVVDYCYSEEKSHLHLEEKLYSMVEAILPKHVRTSEKGAKAKAVVDLSVGFVKKIAHSESDRSAALFRILKMIMLEADTKAVTIGGRRKMGKSSDVRGLITQQKQELAYQQADIRSIIKKNVKSIQMLQKHRSNNISHGLWSKYVRRPTIIDGNVSQEGYLGNQILVEALYGLELTNRTLQRDVTEIELRLAEDEEMHSRGGGWLMSTKRTIDYLFSLSEASGVRGASMRLAEIVKAADILPIGMSDKQEVSQQIAKIHKRRLNKTIQEGTLILEQ